MGELGPFLVPITALMIPIVAIISNGYTTAQRRRIQADQRMALIARGVPLAEIEGLLKAGDAEEESDRTVGDPVRTLANARRTALICISTGIGVIGFLLILGFVFLHHVDTTAGWVILAASATGLVPLAIGVGFLFDYNLQKREMTRFGLEIGAER